MGWLVTKDLELLEKVVKFKHYMSICDSAPSEFLAKVALKHGDVLLTRNTNLIRDNMQLADAFFSRYPKLFSPRPITCGPVPSTSCCSICRSRTSARWRWTRRRAAPACGYLRLDGQYFRMGYGRKAVPEALAKFEEFLIENGFAG